MTELTTLETHKADMHFSAGHFTIFSATEREPLHGHNFTVGISIVTEIDDNGIAFDYGIYKRKIKKICERFDNYFLLPTQSPHLKIEEEGDYTIATFNKERMPFLKKDIILLPIRNISLEDLSAWFINELTQDKAELTQYKIHAMTIKVYSSPGQSASATWRRIS